MKYMLLIYLDEQALDEAERQACYDESTRFVQQLATARQFFAANPLQPPTAMATSVRVREGKHFADGARVQSMLNENSPSLPEVYIFFAFA
ncbi:MAG: hypothetical protein ABI478_13385 [Propionivibrio sp.]